jgi:hypothetical protein
MNTDAELWPQLEYAEWSETCETIHMWTQILGKLKLRLCTPDSHWWFVALAPTPRGLTTGSIPYESITFQVDLDFIHHELKIETSNARTIIRPLIAQSVKSFYFEFMDALEALEIRVTIDTTPKEVPHPIPFDEDTTHASYDRQAVESFQKVLTNCDRALKKFHARFCGKSSPLHFFWGSFDLTLTRFSGRHVLTNEKAEGEKEIEEEFAIGFWPGNESYPNAAFYAYAMPAPAGFYGATIQPSAARFDKKLGEFVLDYDAVRSLEDPQQAIIEFAQSCYEAAAILGNWDRKHLEQLILEPIPK